MHARSALFTLFGDLVRPAGGEAWLTALTECMGALGFTAEATRTALHRMAGEGWVEPRRAGRYAAYRLTRRGVDRLEEAAARIYRLRAADWDGRWRLLVGVPASGGQPLARELQWMGFGRLSPAVWVSPHDHRARVRALLARHGVAAAHLFDAAGAQDDAGVVEQAWDLEGLRAAHARFLERWADVRPSAHPSEAFAVRVRLVHHWRSFLFLDPGLPLGLLPPRWLGHRAAHAFATLYDAVSDASWRFYLDAVERAPGQRHAPRRLPNRQAGSPFSAGLEALGNGRPPAAGSPRPARSATAAAPDPGTAHPPPQALPTAGPQPLSR